MVFKKLHNLGLLHISKPHFYAILFFGREYDIIHSMGSSTRLPKCYLAVLCLHLPVLKIRNIYQQNCNEQIIHANPLGQFLYNIINTKC